MNFQVTHIFWDTRRSTTYTSPLMVLIPFKASIDIQSHGILPLVQRERLLLDGILSNSFFKIKDVICLLFPNLLYVSKYPRLLEDTIIMTVWIAMNQTRQNELYQLCLYLLQVISHVIKGLAGEETHWGRTDRQAAYTINSLLTDTSIRRTPRAGTCLSLLSLFDSLYKSCGKTPCWRGRNTLMEDRQTGCMYNQLSFNGHLYKTDT